MPGVACLLRTFDKPIFLEISPVAPIVENGFTLKEFPKFLETGEGQKFMDSHVWTLKVPARAFFYMPHGYAVFWTYYSTGNEETDVKKGGDGKQTAKARSGAKSAPKKAPKEKQADVAYLLSTPVFGATSGVDAKTISAILAANVEVIKSKGSDPKWKNRGALLEKMFAAA